ncbi:MAG: hypothetical protein AAF483_13965 [Planctomycetota bacterium]
MRSSIESLTVVQGTALALALLLAVVGYWADDVFLMASAMLCILPVFLATCIIALCAFGLSKRAVEDASKVSPAPALFVIIYWTPMLVLAITIAAGVMCTGLKGPSFH